VKRANVLTLKRKTHLD